MPRYCSLRRARCAPVLVFVWGSAMLMAAGALAEERGSKGESVGDLLRSVDLTLGSVRWRAALIDEYRMQRATDGQRSSGFVNSGNASAASYVFQPWFAQLRGSLGFVRSSVSGGERSDSKSVSFTGDAGLSLFPASRFPFDASYAVSDSRASGEITGADFRTTRLGLRQAYRSLDGEQYTARFERSKLSGATFGNDVLDVVEGTYAKRFGAHALEANANHSSNTGGANGTQSTLTRFNGRDSYAPAPNLSVETLASYNYNNFEQVTPTLSNAFTTRFMQVASFANWRPVEGDPLYDENHAIIFTGGLRYSGIVSESSTAATDNQSASASAGMNYTLGPSTRLSAGVTLTQAVLGNGASGGGLSTSENVNVSHAPAPLPLGAFLYSWNVNGGASNSTGGASSASAAPGVPSARQVVSAQGNHSLSRNFQLTPRSSLSLTLGQSAATNLSAGGSTESLTHNASAFWSLAGDSAAQAYVSLSGSDSRFFGATRGDFQLVNVQLTRQAPSGPLSFWTANLTVQGSRQNLESTVPGSTVANSGGFNFATTGSVTYQHQRFLNVPRLRLFVSYTANQAQLQSRTLGDLNAPRELVSGALDARLDYQIGKVDARLSFRTANIDHQRNSLLFLRIARNF